MSLTGWPAAPPLAPRRAALPRLEEAAARFGTLSARMGRRVDVDVATMVTGRSALLGLSRQGRTSAGGTCRLLPAVDGWVAVNLTRPSDHELVAAVVGGDLGGA